MRRPACLTLLLAAAAVCGSLHFGAERETIWGTYEHRFELNGQVGVQLELRADGAGSFHWPWSGKTRRVDWRQTDGTVHVEGSLSAGRVWSGRYHRDGGELLLVAVRRDVGDGFEQLAEPQRYARVRESGAPKTARAVLDAP